MPTVNDLTTPAEDEAVKAKTPGVTTLAGVITDLGFTALFAWVGGIALHRGFGMSVPFVAAWLLLLTVLYVAQIFTGQLAKIWHRERVNADINLLAASMAAQEAVQAESLLAMNKKIKDMSSKVDGGYL